jgi:hypothetical protein
MSRKLLVFFLQFSGVPKVTTPALEAKPVAAKPVAAKPVAAKPVAAKPLKRSHGMALLRIIKCSSIYSLWLLQALISFTKKTCFALHLFLWQAAFC